MMDFAVSSRGAMVAAIVSVSVAGAGLSLSIPLMALRMEEAGYSAEANGLGVAIAGLSTLFYAPFVPALAAKAGMTRFMLLSLLLSVLTLGAFAATAFDLRLWWPLRAVFSCALTGMFVTSEFAVNALAPPARRGVWIGVYSTSLAVGFAVGPLLLRTIGSGGFWPFGACAALFALAALPILASGDGLPVLPRHLRSSTLSFLKRSPGLMSAVFVFGAIETGAMGLLPVHALRNGMSAETGAVFVAALAGGNMLLQIPLGFLSDRLSRRLLLLGMSVIATVGALTLAVLTHSPWFIPLLVVWSGAANGLYMIGLAELGGRYQGGELAAANATFVVCYASGMVFGPPLVGWALDAAPANGLFLSLAGLSALTLMLQVLRLRATATR